MKPKSAEITQNKSRANTPLNYLEARAAFALYRD